MLTMIIKMTAVTAMYVILTALLWKFTKNRRMKWLLRTVIGILYGIGAVLSTHFGVDYSDMMLNVRDMGPLSAGLFFDPISGIIAGLIGGIERFIAGTYWGVGSFTRIACSVSTCLAGFVAAGMRIFLFKRKKPSATYAFFMGAVMEVFHMYVVFITHRDDMDMAFKVVKTCSPPMIIFTGLGMAISSVVLMICAGEWKNPFRKRKEEEISVSQRFRFWLFAVTLTILVVNLLFSISLQTRTEEQDAKKILTTAAVDIRQTYKNLRRNEEKTGIDAGELLSNFHVGRKGTFDIVLANGNVILGNHKGTTISVLDQKILDKQKTGEFFQATLFGTESLCRFEELEEGVMLLVKLPVTEVFADRDAQTYESVFAAIVLFSVIYVLISLLVQSIVVNNLELVNASLGRITRGNLNEVVSVRKSSEFASLSDDINQTVDVLKGYIDAAEKRIEQELEFARTIQASSLPANFDFPRKDFEIYATMDPAKEVGGDFYDFFFVGKDKLAMVVADVSGKGIPAALFMMRAKTAIRGLAESGLGPAEILGRANNTLCEGNEAEMFVTVWLGIIDLTTGKMISSNAGHEYPLLMRAEGDYEYIRDKHGLALAAMEDMSYREYEMDLYPGDRLFVYTDGIPEAIDVHEEQYGTERLAAVLNTLKLEPSAKMLPAVRKDIADFVGEADQFDDITMLGFLYLGASKDE